ncbi:hypothetical protein BLA29_000071 [Euroglyphus maynei]|uniref:Uncharacterized protein n=1 Tax=Euroglyphus maynei TaxID=6958 RepID=A0A1Y3B0L8_EURMA|nr:hypothetical protein BLA29_000071 [Euroglyphus maynei]
MALIIIPFECFEIDSQQSPLSTFSYADKMADVPVNQLLIVGYPDLIRPLSIKPSPPPSNLSPILTQLFGPQSFMLQMDADNRNMDENYPKSMMMNDQQALPTTLNEIEQDSSENEKKISHINDDKLEKFSTKFQGFISELKIKWKIRPLNDDDEDEGRKYKKRFRRYRRPHHHHHDHFHENNEIFEPDST